jgi:hypothetical protein
MPKDGYYDYSKASDYFESKDDNLLGQDIETVEKQKQFVVWVQSFSKRIVIIVFWLYIMSSIFSLFLVYLSWKAGYTTGLDTLISEINQTFRDVIGGYIIKSAAENSFKIIGNYLVGIADARLRAMENKHMAPINSQPIDINNKEEEFNEFDRT